MKTSLFICLLLLFSCKSPNHSEEKKEIKTDTIIQKTDTISKAEKTVVAKLKFKNFEFGDAEHYYFEDEKGNEIQFGFSKAENIDFAIEVKPNETNQGFGPNPKLLGKWFEITHTTEKRQLYQDGPEGEVQVILQAKEVKK